MTETPAPEIKSLLRVENLVKHFATDSGFWGRSAKPVRAVDGISFSLSRGETLGLVGESGCGKTTAARTILRMIPPTAGQVWLDDQNVFSAGHKEMKALRKRMQLIFQDPFSSLNPRMSIGSIIGEGLSIHFSLTAAEREARTAQLLTQVGLQPEFARRYPHEFSGGQRQRVGIARALATEPELIICDEPVSALDVSVQAQVLNLLADLQASRGLAYLFISHDLAVVRHICNRVAVMYLGQIVESAPAKRLYQQAAHPYTQALLSAIPSVSKSKGERIMLEGDPPSPANIPSGCRFHPRCPAAQADGELLARCSTQEPPAFDLGDGHTCCCFTAERMAV